MRIPVHRARRKRALRLSADDRLGDPFAKTRIDYAFNICATSQSRPGRRRIPGCELLVEMVEEAGEKRGRRGIRTLRDLDGPSLDAHHDRKCMEAGEAVGVPQASMFAHPAIVPDFAMSRGVRTTLGASRKAGFAGPALTVGADVEVPPQHLSRSDR